MNTSGRDYRDIAAGSTERFFTVVNRGSGAPIEPPVVVNYYLKAKSGAEAGKWWRDSDQTWQAIETANPMTHEADGHWEIDLTTSPFDDSLRYVEYMKAVGNAHVPDLRHLIAIADDGRGAHAIALTIRLTDTTIVAGADVWVTVTGNTTIIASGKSAGDGTLAFQLDAGSYDVHRQKTGFNFTPQPITVIGPLTTNIDEGTVAIAGAVLFTSLAEFKRRLDIPAADTSEDQVLLEILEQVEAAIITALKRPNFIDPGSDVTLYFDGPGRRDLITPRPITVITEIREDIAGRRGSNPNGFDSTTILDPDDDYFPNGLTADEHNAGIIHRVGINWNSHPGSVMVKGRFGYTTGGGGTFPVDLARSAYKAGALIRNSSEAGDTLKSERIGKYAYAIAGGDASEVPGASTSEVSSIYGTIRHYREVVI